jgi:hypothetical protein
MKLLIKLVFYRNYAQTKLIRVGLMKHNFKSVRLNSNDSSTGIFYLENAVIDSVSGYIFDENSNLIEQSTSWGKDHAGKRWPAIPIFPRKISSSSPKIFLGSSAYYHWLIEDVPAYLKAKRINAKASTVIRKDSPRYVTDLLNILGESFSELPVYSIVPNLILAEKSTALMPVLPDVQLILSVTEKISLATQNFERIYISRTLSGRIPANEVEIEEMFVNFGFKIIHLENLKLDEQIDLFKNADVVAGTHGAGLANLVWAKMGCKVIEIARFGQPDCFGQIAKLVKLDNLILESTSDPWVVDLDNLNNLLIGSGLKNLKDMG